MSTENYKSLLSVRKIFTRFEFEEFFEMLTDHLQIKGYVLSGTKLYSLITSTYEPFAVFEGWDSYDAMSRGAIFDIPSVAEVHVILDYSPFHIFPPKYSPKVIDGELSVWVGLGKTVHDYNIQKTGEDSWFGPIDMSVKEKLEVVGFVKAVRSFLPFYKKIKQHRLRQKKTKKV